MLVKGGAPASTQLIDVAIQVDVVDREVPFNAFMTTLSYKTLYSFVVCHFCFSLGSLSFTSIAVICSFTNGRKPWSFKISLIFLSDYHDN